MNDRQLAKNWTWAAVRRWGGLESQQQRWANITMSNSDDNDNSSTDQPASKKGEPTSKKGVEIRLSELEKECWELKTENRKLRAEIKKSTVNFYDLHLPLKNDWMKQTADENWKKVLPDTSREGFRRRGSFIWFRGKWGVLEKKGVTLRRLRISEKKEILRKLTVFDDGGDSNCRSSLSRCLASIRGPSLLIIEL